jgi:hypothetical protein
MMHELLKTVVLQSIAETWTVPNVVGVNGPVDFTATGSKLVFNATAPVRLLKWGFLCDATAVVTGGSNLVFTLYFNPTAGSTASQAALDTLTVVDPSSAYVLGTGAYRDPFVASTVSTTPPSEVAAAGPLGASETISSGQMQDTLQVGQSWSISVTTAATTSGAGRLFIEYVLLPITKPSGYGVTSAGTVSLTENYTRLAS